METLETLGVLIGFGREMSKDLPLVPEALAAVRAMCNQAKVPYRIVGGLAVLHHGYARTTRDIDLIASAADLARLDPLLASFGFERLSPRKLRHKGSGVAVDLLLSGEPIPRANGALYPSPSDIAGSPAEPDVAALEPLIMLKLLAHRSQDQADVVALLKPLSADGYLRLEAAIPPALRPALAELKRDADDEKRFEST